MPTPTTATTLAAPETANRGRLLTSSEVAQFLGCTTRHVFNLRKRGLPAYRVGDMVRFDLDEVREWLQLTGAESRDPKRPQRDVAAEFATEVPAHT